MYDDYSTRFIDTGGNSPKHVVDLGCDNGAAYGLVFLRKCSMFKFRLSTTCEESGQLHIRIREPQQHASPTSQTRLELHSACWDAYTGCVFAALGCAVVRVAENGDASVVAGHPTETGDFTAQQGCLDGTGLNARFDTNRCCNDLVSDGGGCLYLVDSGRLRRLQLPAAWRAQPTEGGGAAPAARWGFPELDEGEEEDDEQQQQQGQGAASLPPAAGVPATAPGSRPLPAGEVVVTTVCCGPLDGRLRWQAYDPASRCLVLCTRKAVYRLPVAGLGAATGVHSPVLVAGKEAGRSQYADGVGTEARFVWIEGVTVDGSGTAWVLEHEWYSFWDPDRDPDESDVSEDVDEVEEPNLQLRRVRPDGEVAIITESDRMEPYTFYDSAPAVLHNGWLAVVSRCEKQVLLVQMGLPPPAIGTVASPSPRDSCPAPGTLSSDLGELLHRQPDGSTDVEVEVGGQVFAAHRLVLAVRSPYFRQRLDPGAGFADGRAPRLSLPDADPAAFGAVLRFMYTDSAGPVPPELLQPVGELADRLLLRGLCEQVCSQLLGRVSLENVVGLLLWAEQRGGSYGALLTGLKEWFLRHHNPEDGRDLSDEDVVRLMREAPELGLQLLYRRRVDGA